MAAGILHRHLFSVNTAQTSFAFCSSLLVRNYGKKMSLPKVFFDMSADGAPVGRIVMEVSSVLSISFSFDCIASNVGHILLSNFLLFPRNPVNLSQETGLKNWKITFIMHGGVFQPWNVLVKGFQNPESFMFEVRTS